MKAPVQSENSVQRDIVAYLRTVLPDCIVFAIPNASRRTAAGRASNAVPGLFPGVPDLEIVWSGGKSFFIEVKNATGRLSPAQDDLLARFIKLGVPYAVCRSIDDARAAIADWGLPIRETSLPQIKRQVA